MSTHSSKLYIYQMKNNSQKITYFIKFSFDSQNNTFVAIILCQLKNMPRTVKEINILFNKIRLQTAEILKQKTVKT